jgi:glucokinase
MKKFAVGIDIGGTNTKFGIVDREGTILTQGRMLTNARDTVQGFIE